MSTVEAAIESINGNGDYGVPKYERLKKHLLKEVEAGRLGPGAALPPEQKLAEGLNMARGTVRQAMAALEREGIIRRVRGRGTFIHEDARRKLRRGLEVFALIVPETQAGYYPSLLRGFDEAAGCVHSQIIVANSNNDLDRQGNIILQLLDKRVSGIAIVPTAAQPTPAYQIRQIQRQGIAVVFCHRGVEGVTAPLVTFSGVEVGRLAGQALVGRGHRCVAFFGSSPSAMSSAYEAGLRQALREAGGDLPESLIFYGGRVHPADPVEHQRHEAKVLENLQRMLALEHRPTAIMTSFDSEAELIYLLLGRLGVRVPQDISLIGFGGTWRDGALMRRLTSVTVNEAELGRRAVELLEQMRSGARAMEDDERIEMELGLSEGETLGPPPATAMR